MTENPVQQIAQELGMVLKENDLSVGRRWLADRVNELIRSDFQKLVSILYRIDVDEARLKMLLKENPGDDAGNIIAGLMIERQLQKIKSRQEFSRRDNAIDDDEKWDA